MAALNLPTQANIDEHESVSAGAKPAAPSGGGDNGSSSLRPPQQPWPKLLLDSGASIHAVGDAQLLSNLRDAPAGMTIRVANGDTLPVTKIGDIQMIAAGFTIPDVHLAPGLKSDLISVRVLTRSRIRTWIDGERATLYAGPEVVGVAVAPQEEYGLYVLQSLSVPKIAAASSANCLDGEMKLVWHSAFAGAPRPIEDEAPAATISFPPSRSMDPTPKKEQKCVDSSSAASKSRTIGISCKNRGKYGDSNTGTSKRTRSGTNQPEPFPIEVKAKKKVKARSNNKVAARGGLKNDIVQFDGPAMATRSKRRLSLETIEFVPSKSRTIGISSKNRGKYGDSNTGTSKRSRSGSDQHKPFPIEVNVKTIVKAKKKVKAKSNNKQAARGGAKNDIVLFDSPAMATRSKAAALASRTMATPSKTIVKAKKKVKARWNNKVAARGGLKNDIVQFDGPAMATRSKRRLSL